MKVAAILFVKNEVEDITWWLAWHLSIGIDTLVIYDDYSSDGTWEVINSASKIYDIRPRRATQSLRFNHRQALTYMDALDELREEFDWLVVLDADEYIDIRNGESVHSFLSRYPDDVGGIALNWKCFGSNRHVEKPSSPNALENYTTHSEIDFELNQCVKSFFRPKETETRYINPHRFAISGRYITPNGKEVEWQSQHDERTVAQPDWSTALVRHYIIRSAEHFVEKSKRRSDIRGSRIGIGLFNAYDKNEFVDTMDPARIQPMFSFVYGIQNQFSIDYMLKGVNLRPTVCIKRLKTVFDTQLVTNIRDGRLGHASFDTTHEDLRPVCVFSITEIPDYVFLTIVDEFVPLHLSGEGRVSTILSYKTVRIQDHTIGLQSPLTRKIVSFLPHDAQTEGDIAPAEADRDWTNAWETLTVVEDAIPTDDLHLLRLASLIVNCKTPVVPTDDTDTRTMADAVMAGLSILSDQEMREINAQKNIKSIPWLNQSNLLSL